MDLISRELAMSHPFANGQYDHENANEDFILGFEAYKEWLEQLPSAEPQTGKWIFGFGDEWNCSKCDYLIHTDGSWEHPTSIGYKFCPNCGKRMEVDNETD